MPFEGPFAKAQMCSFGKSIFRAYLSVQIKRFLSKNFS